MKSFKLFYKQAGMLFAVAAIAVASFMPALVSADALTTRSIALSTATSGATGVSYTVAFTAAKAAGAFVVDFCSDTPLIGQTCTAPTGMDFSSATSTDTLAAKTASRVTVTKTINASDNVSVVIAGAKNPTSVGVFYARLLTFDTAGNAALYAPTTAPASLAGLQDSGSVALSTTNDVSVSGAVLETMTFCVSGEDGVTHLSPITSNCGGTLTAPTLKLGKDTNGVIALDSSAVYTGTIYTQISTNAVSGAVVNLKNSVACGGLHRDSADAATCDVVAAGGTPSDNVVAGQAKFGVKTGAADSTSDSTQAGTIQPGGVYDSTNYRMNYTGAGTGVTSTYGDPIFNTNSAPANNKNMPLTFGASVSNNTPAGNYSASLSLVATGKF